MRRNRWRSEERIEVWLACPMIHENGKPWATDGLAGLEAFSKPQDMIEVLWQSG